jgi:hypothetical protein
MEGNISLDTSISPRYFMYSLLQTKEIITIIIIVVVAVAVVA